MMVKTIKAVTANGKTVNKEFFYCCSHVAREKLDTGRWRVELCGADPAAPRFIEVPGDVDKLYLINDAGNNFETMPSYRDQKAVDGAKVTGSPNRESSPNRGAFHR